MKKRVTGTGGYRTRSGEQLPFKSFEASGREIRHSRAAADRALAKANVADHTKCPECGEPKPITAIWCRRCFYDLKGWSKDPDSI